MTDECRIENVDGIPVIVRGGQPMDDEDRTYLAEIVDAAKRKYENEQRCDKTDLIIAQCAHCRPKDEPTVVASCPPFMAAWSGECVGLCDRSIQPGEEIVRCDGGGYAHKGCAT